jgi:hypothetical protein
LSNDTTAEVFDDILYSKVDSERGGGSSGRPEPLRTIDWRAQGTALGEHIAGPNCENTQGYNGNNISAEEMRTCTTIQCLAERQWQWPPEWKPEPDDEVLDDIVNSLSAVCISFNAPAAYDISRSKWCEVCG